jgi:GNAT superfamily N-acetyltransferase
MRDMVHARDGVIIFRHLGDLVPPEWWAGFRWQVEYHHEDDRGFPVAVAWVLAPPPDGSWPAGTHCPRETLMYIQVADDERRRGFATRLVRACVKRWPNIYLTDAAGGAGEGLLAKFPQNAD